MRNSPPLVGGVRRGESIKSMFILSAVAEVLRHKKTKALLKKSWLVCWPMTMIMFFVFLIGLADIYVAGRISKEVQASYGVAAQLYFILSVVGFALNTGCVTIVSQLYTSGRKKEFISSIDTTITISAVAGAVLGIAGFLLAHPLIHIMNIPEALKDKSAVLVQIYSLGLVPAYFLLNTNGILRACDRIKRSMFTMAVVCILNVILNFVLAFKTPLGFRGIAVATIASTLIGCLMNAFSLKPLCSGFFKFSFAAAKQIFSIGWPMGLMQVIWQMAAMALYVILARLPKDNIETIAAFTNGLRIEAVIFLPVFAFNMANAVVVGNLLGEKNKEDAFLIGRLTALTGVAVTLVMVSLVMFNAPAISVLLSADETVVRECSRYIRIALFFEPVMAWAVILAGALNGAGDTKGVLVIVGLCVWLVRVPCAYVLALICGWGAVGVWWAMNLSLAVQAVFISRRYFRRRWLDCSL